MFSMFRQHASRPSVEEAAAPLCDTEPAPDNPGNPDRSLADRVLASETNRVPVVEPDASNRELPDGDPSPVREEDPHFAHADDRTSTEQVMPPVADPSADGSDAAPSAVSDDLELLVEDVDRRAQDAELRGWARGARRRGSSRALTKKPAVTRPPLTAEQRLLMLDTWIRSGLPAGDFAPLIGISKHTLYKWKEQFQELGPAGLMDQPRRVRRGSQLPELTRRTILMLKEAHREWGCQRISDMLCRGPALPASASAVARVLHEAGYEAVDVPTASHPDKVRRFERARPNQLWQTDLFTFVLKRQNRRLHMVAFLDDHSRFIVSYGLHATASTALVIEALEAAIAAYGPAEEVLTDNGPQYVTWRGTSQFTRHLQKRGIKQIVARPRRPQTLGKVERFWGTLWREFLEAAIFVDLATARAGHFSAGCVSAAIRGRRAGRRCGMNGSRKTVARKTPSSPNRAAPSGEAHRRAAVILEVLAGVRTAPEGAAALKISVNYYYVMERQALRGLVAGCEPRPKGQRPNHERQLAALRQALERSQRACQRQAALVRVTQRAVGLPATPTPPVDHQPPRGRKGKTGPRRRRATAVRALRLARTLAEKSVARNGADPLQPVAEATGNRPVLGKEDTGDDTSRT
jgi:transposase InsO family protein